MTVCQTHGVDHDCYWDERYVIEPIPISVADWLVSPLALLAIWWISRACTDDTGSGPHPYVVPRGAPGWRW